MKPTLILIALTAFAATEASALQVGDQAIYTETQNGQSVQASITVTAINGDDYTAQGIVNGVKQNDTHASISEFTTYSDPSNCAKMPGVMESLTTEAGTFQVCHFSFGNVAIYLSSLVPFGTVQVVSPTQTMVLKSFSRK